MARRPTGRPARHVAKGVGPGLSRNPSRFTKGDARTRGRVSRSADFLPVGQAEGAGPGMLVLVVWDGMEVGWNPE